ncbi:hypothetical protein, partial [Pseudomonas sp. W5-01]|uniref:hypothetical protein n=1 Tax=Pseudomonas sp. W5-01 TaxID=3097454 RepID=UPI00397E32F7
MFVTQARNAVDAAAIQVESGRAAAQRSAQAAAASEANAAAVVTGGTASFNPAPGNIPIGSAESKINEDWLPASVARTQRVNEVATQAAHAEQLATSLNGKVTTAAGAGQVPQAGEAGVLAEEWMPQSLARVSALQAPDGADDIGYEGGTVKDELDKAKVLLDYVELRAYSGDAMRVTLTRAGIAGDFLRIAAQSGRADNGGTYVIASNGAAWSRVYEGKVHAAWFEGSTDLAIIQRAIDEAIAVGVQEVLISRQYVCVGALKNRTNVRFVGDGQLSGNASYRVRVIPESAPTTSPKFYDLDPARHLKAFSNARAPVVVLTGSSTGTWNPNTVDTGGGVAAMLSLRIKQLNPEKKITFFNRCIGGQTFANLDGKPSAFPGWYADSSRAWIDYISDVKPDVIYIIMGSNDSSAISSAALTSAVAKMKAFAKVPDLVFITQPSVCADPNDAYASYGSYADQEGRDFAAGLVRSFAIYNGHGLIDGNRMGGIVLDGRDILTTSMKRFASSVDTPAGLYTCPVAAHDFTLNLAFVGDAGANTAAFSLTGNPNNPPFVRVGAGGGSGSSGDIVQIRKDANGFFVFQCYCAGVNYQTINT